MDNVHSSHSSSSIVENPFFVKIHIATRELRAQLPNDHLNYLTSVVSVCSDSSLGEIVQVSWVEDVEFLEVGIKDVED